MNLCDPFFVTFMGRHKLRWHLLALLHLLHGLGLFGTSSQWPSSLCGTSKGTVHQRWNQVGCAHGRWQAMLGGEHSSVLLGSMRHAAGGGSSHVRVLQLAELQGGKCKASGIRILSFPKLKIDEGPKWRGFTCLKCFSIYFSWSPLWNPHSAHLWFFWLYLDPPDGLDNGLSMFVSTGLWSKKERIILGFVACQT